MERQTSFEHTSAKNTLTDDNNTLLGFLSRFSAAEII